jgi:hypothetical protein
VERAYETYLQDQNPHALFSEWSIWKRCWGSVRGKRDTKVGRPGREWERLRTAEDMVYSFGLKVRAPFDGETPEGFTGEAVFRWQR